MRHKKRRSMLWLLFLCVLLVALGTTLLFFFLVSRGQPVLKKIDHQIPALEGTLHGLVVTTGEKKDFPGKAGLSQEEMEAQLKEISEFAETYGFNAVFFEAAPNGAAFYRSTSLPSSPVWGGKQGKSVFFDPLTSLIESCKEKGIQVYAVVPGFCQEQDFNLKNKKDISLTASVVDELTRNYDIAGVVLTGIDAKEIKQSENAVNDIAKIMEQCKSKIDAPSFQRFGIAISSYDKAEFFAEAVSYADFVMSSKFPDPVEKTEDFLTALSSWQNLCQKIKADFYFLHGTANHHEAENAMWLEKQHGVEGMIFSHYGALHKNDPITVLSLSASFQQKPEEKMPDFSFSQEFAVTRPTDGITLDYTWENYFVTGTSVPGIPVTVNGVEIPASSKGLWGYLVPLNYGTNQVTFAQENFSATVTIVRNKPAARKISAIQSPYPSYQEVVLEGRALRLSCTAPAGSTVTASLGSLTETLSPSAAGEDGTSVIYQGQMDVSSLGKAGQVLNVGPVTYHLSYNDVQSRQPSAGSVYITGPGAVPVAKINSIGMVNQNAANDGQYVSILRPGCVDMITDNVGGYYGLSLGGYILKEAVNIEAGETSPVSQISGTAMETTEKGEKFIIAGSQKPAYKGTLTKENLTINIRNLSGSEKIDPSQWKSELCSQIEMEQQDDNSITLVFHFDSKTKIAGWDVLYDENNQMAVYLRKKPVIDWNSTQPLSGVTIALDPGHGGKEPGALGVPGLSGPTEALLNLADSYALRSRLTALGADVHILQENTDSTLNNRLALCQQLDADLFISSHHNSISETVDANQVTGIEVYYWNDWSADFARNIGENLSAQTGRKVRDITQSWYRVTMTYACPSVLVESGFLSNPTEYESLCNEYAMFRYGIAVTDAVLQYLKE